VGGYTDWVRQRTPAPAPSRETRGTTAPAPAEERQRAASSNRSDRKRKLSFRETNELASLPESIDALERERSAIYASLTDPVVLRDGAATASAKGRLSEIESELAKRLARWEELETIAAG